MHARILLAIPAIALASAAGEAAENKLKALSRAGVEGSSSTRSARLEGTSWTINSPIPEPLGVAQGATVASADGSRIYHIGGITGAMTASNRVWVYSTADDTWSKATDIPVEPGIRTFGAAVELDGRIYVFGGFDGENIFDTTWIYDEAKDEWFQGANMPGPRFGSAVVTDGDTIWVALGFEGSSRGDEATTVWQYDPSGNAWSLAGYASPLGRCRGVLLPNGDMHFLAGGFDGVAHVGVNFREHYSFTRPQIPVGVTDPAVVIDAARIYVTAGGGPAPRQPGRTQIFNTVSRTWSEGPLMPSGIDNTSGVVANGTLYVMGGYDGSTPVSVNYSLTLFSVDEQETISAGAMNGDGLKPSGSPELKLDGQFDGNPWSTNWHIPEVFGVAQGSTLSSSDGSVIYHLGGLVGSGVYVSNRLRAYSPADDVGDAAAMGSPWWDVASIPLSRGIRSYGSAVELNGFIYVFGGVSGTLPSEEVLNTTWIYDEANDTWSQGVNMPGYRAGPAVASDGAVIWVIGGYNQFQGPDHNVWRYDPKADAYSTGFRDIPRDLGRIHGAWLPDGTVHVLGGGGPGPFDNHLVYDTAADAWFPAASIPLGVLDPATVTDGTLIYLAGAPDGPFPRPPGLIQIFDPAKGKWFDGPQMPGPWGIDNTSGTIAKGIFYVMGGSWGGGSTMSMNYSIPLSYLVPSIAEGLTPRLR